MKKSIFAVILPVTTLLLSSCLDASRPISTSPIKPTTTEQEEPTSASVGTTSSTTSKSDFSTTISTSENSSTNEGFQKTKLEYDYNDYCENNAYSSINCPTTGSPNVLIIPIWFTDSISYISTTGKQNVRSDIQTAYFGTNTETGWRSVKTYYEELSNGKLTLKGKVANWYSAGFASTSCSQTATETLVKNATDDYFSKNPTDSRNNYDLDKDGYLDAVVLIYGAPDYSTANSSNSNLWAYCYWLNPKTSDEPVPFVFFWASYDFMYSSSKALSRTGKSDFGGGDTSHCKIDAHTYIHEFGHVLGLEDYYDYSGKYNPAGAFSMQDYNVGSHDPFSVMALGWADPFIPKETMTIELKPFQSSKEIILLSNHNETANSPFDEYLLLELYTPTGLNEFDNKNSYIDRYPTGADYPGIRLWHVDARLTKYVYSGKQYSWSTELSTDASEQGICVAMSNTYYGNASSNDYCSVLGSSYYDYNLLQLIRNYSSTYRPDDDLLDAALFKKGASFNMNDSRYSSQFKNKGKLNSSEEFGWEFTVNSCSDGGASITVTKL